MEFHDSYSVHSLALSIRLKAIRISVKPKPMNSHQSLSCWKRKLENFISANPEPSADARSRSKMAIKPSSNSWIFYDRPTVAQFAEDTTIHGVKDLFRVWPQNGWLKWTWIFLLLASTGSMLYEMIQVILSYLARPTATQISQMHLDHYDYPPMLFCPRYWINATRVKNLVLPKNSLAYALSFLHLLQLSIDPHSIDMKTTATDLNKVLLKNGFKEVFQLFINISDDSDQIMTCTACKDWPARKVVTEDGVCYVLKLKPAKLSFLIEHPPQITYNPMIPKLRDAENWIPSYTTKHCTEQFYVGYFENDFFGTDPIRLWQNKSYVIKITPTLQKRFSGYLSKAGRGCHDKEALIRINYSQRMCYSSCEEWAFGPECWEIQYMGYSYEKPAFTRPQWYSSLTYPDKQPPQKKQDECMKLKEQEYETCAAECLPTCEEFIYDTTVVSVNNRRLWIDKEDAAITIVISYQVKAGTLAVEEISTYTYHTFLSNIGGQMGLWLGASVLSVFQLIFFLIRSAYDRWSENRRPAPNLNRNENGYRCSARF